MKLTYEEISKASRLINAYRFVKTVIETHKTNCIAIQAAMTGKDFDWLLIEDAKNSMLEFSNYLESIGKDLK